MPRAWQPAGFAAAVATLLGDDHFSLSPALCELALRHWRRRPERAAAWQAQ